MSSYTKMSSNHLFIRGIIKTNEIDKLIIIIIIIIIIMIIIE